MLIPYYDRMILREFPDSSYASCLRIYIAKLKFKRECDKVITPLIHKLYEITKKRNGINSGKSKRSTKTGRK